MSVEDWKHALFQLDENQSLNIQRWLVDIEHLTVVLYDIIHKNMVWDIFSKPNLELALVSMKLVKTPAHHHEEGDMSYYL